MGDRRSGQRKSSEDLGETHLEVVVVEARVCWWESMIAVVQDLYIPDPPAAILVNWFGVEDGVDWGTIWGVRPTVGSGTNIDFIFPANRSNIRLRFLGITRGPGTAAGPCEGDQLSIV